MILIWQSFLINKLLFCYQHNVDNIINCYLAIRLPDKNPIQVYLSAHSFSNSAIQVLDYFECCSKVVDKHFNQRTNGIMLIVVISVFLVAFAFYTHLTWHFDYWRTRGVAGPIPRAYLGTFPKTAKLDRNSNYIEETTEIYR